MANRAAKRGRFKLKSKHFDARLQGKAADAESEFTTEQIVEQCFNLLTKLSWEGKNGAYIFFDELNLSFSSRKQHARDAILIRDLIIAIDRLNDHFISLQKPVYLIAAARSEVLNALNVPTLEINKIMSDRGAELRWFGQTASDDWPIVRLLESKIHASEKLAGVRKSDVYRDYFPREIYGMSPKNFVVELTWCNPRDLILLFGKAAKDAFAEHRFSENVFVRVLDRMSEEAWNERAEELNVEYARGEIECIKKILLNFRPFFKADQFVTEGKQKSGDQAIQALMKKRTATKILGDLYRVGIIGQSTRPPLVGIHDRSSQVRQLREHWAYRGDQNFDPTAYMVVHRALYPQLRLGDIRPNATQLRFSNKRRD